MSLQIEKYREILSGLDRSVCLVAVSKTKPEADIQALYELGQRDFGENYVQELVDKAAHLPTDIRWHFIGHLQSNKVKYIAPFVHLIHGVDSGKLLLEIDKQGRKSGRVLSVLLQMHIAQEETKFGLDESELDQLLEQIRTSPLTHVQVLGLMGMASFSSDADQVRTEFKYLKQQFDRVSALAIPGVSMQWLSMGMSGDYALALAQGSNMIRIGSLLFGSR
jgi:pyridoxal phosphate enzyme (YggS family)